MLRVRIHEVSLICQLSLTYLEFLDNILDYIEFWFLLYLELGDLYACVYMTYTCTHPYRQISKQTHE